jgi:hypothetical protein
MRVRCTFCGAEYEAPVTRAAVALVGRCEYCRRARLEPVDEDGPPDGGGDPAPPPRDAGEASATPLAPRRRRAG